MPKKEDGCYIIFRIIDTSSNDGLAHGLCDGKSFRDIVYNLVTVNDDIFGNVKTLPSLEMFAGAHCYYKVS